MTKRGKETVLGMGRLHVRMNGQGPQDLELRPNGTQSRSSGRRNSSAKALGQESAGCAREQKGGQCGWNLESEWAEYYEILFDYPNLDMLILI